MDIVKVIGPEIADPLPVWTVDAHHLSLLTEISYQEIAHHQIGTVVLLFKFGFKSDVTNEIETKTGAIFFPSALLISWPTFYKLEQVVDVELQVFFLKKD